MILSEHWLREWLALDAAMSADDLAAQITKLGLEVDAISPAAPLFSGVVVGKVAAIAAHPDADKLNICQVEDGEGVYEVVCGAANARAGIKIPFAKVGAKLPNDFKIKTAKLRGVVSNGMLCSAAELGLAETSTGLLELPEDAPVGADIRAYMQLEDTLIDIDLTPNRGDCLSVLGVARELANSLNIALTPPAEPEIAITATQMLNISVQAPDYCPRYFGRALMGIDTDARSPLWLQERLRRAGVRVICPAVDVGNYVMLELGQPLHAFDMDKLAGGIDVRLARQGETIALLDGSSRTLDEKTLVIADANGAQAIAGVMGGEASAVSISSRNIFFESAFFSPEKIIGKPRQYQLHTDASHRYERGVDPSLQERALARATALLQSIAGGSAAPICKSEAPEFIPKRLPITLRQARVEKLLGFALSGAQIEGYLTGLGIQLERQQQGVWQALAPAHRFDLSIEADLIEELVRLYGYDNVHKHSRSQRIIRRSGSAIDSVFASLVARGYQQAICYSFVGREGQQLFDPHLEPLALANPISQDLAVMRTSLLPGLVAAVRNNLNRQQKTLRFFESGLVFLPQEGDVALKNLRQQKQIAGVICGARHDESWHKDDLDVDFFDLKADVEALLATSGAQFSFAKADSAHLHPGQAAAAYKLVDGQLEWVGTFGRLHPQLQKQLKIKVPLWVFELVVEKIWAAPKVSQYQKVSEFPARRRDLAIVVNREVSAQQLTDAIYQVAPPELVGLNIFDVYQGPNLESTTKSVAFCLILQALSRTLGDDEVEAMVAKILQHLAQQFAATLRV